MTIEKSFKDSVVINLNKPPDITSHQAGRKVQRILGASKSGHAGTLDPFAEGVLLVCLNDATRITEYLSSLEKEYIAHLQLGIVTDTLDITGSIIKEENPAGITEDRIIGVLRQFKGELMQMPPMYSAIKQKGVPLYKLARKGITVQREERRVFIAMMELLSFSLPEFVVRIRCSKGTYIRSIARDIGEALGVGAVVKRLQRTAIGHFKIEDSVSFEALGKGVFTFSTMDEALGRLNELTLNEDQFRLAGHGTGFFAEVGISGGEPVRLKSPAGDFFAIGKLKDGGFMKIEKVFSHRPVKT
ncbi:tRNA pseudouridine(55) synthase [hydrothermal vent metagenome]|uniref:tRNA pseudouridine(55) synthase n=1 Tax=hydrothermal vent metagenome TaxID=652676 RepID=A0A3B1DGR9_9ZZZZ